MMGYLVGDSDFRDGSSLLAYFACTCEYEFHMFICTVSAVWVRALTHPSCQQSICTLGSCHDFGNKIMCIRFFTRKKGSMHKKM